MTAAQHSDPWASSDHDPTSIAETVVHQARITTRHALKLARADLHEAVANEGHTRRQYAQSACDYAHMVLGAPDAMAHQRELAGYYLADAEILTHN